MDNVDGPQPKNQTQNAKTKQKKTKRNKKGKCEEQQMHGFFFFDLHQSLAAATKEVTSGDEDDNDDDDEELGLEREEGDRRRNKGFTRESACVKRVRTNRAAKSRAFFFDSSFTAQHTHTHPSH